MERDYERIILSPVPIFMGAFPISTPPPAPIVVNLCGDRDFAPTWGQTVVALPMRDSPLPEDLPDRAHFERFLAAVHIFARHEASYWHCLAGLNRCGFALSAYLHLFWGMSISEAIALLREKRSPWVLCNPTFEGTLRSWYGTAAEQDFTPISFEDYLRERYGRSRGEATRKAR